MKTKSYTRIVVASIALLAALLATPAMANCFQDAKTLYDSCVTFQYTLNGTLYNFSEQACAEASAEATNACLVNSGKLDPSYSECRARWDYYIPSGSNCPSGWYYTEDAFVNLEARQCNGYQFSRMTINCG